MKVGILDIQGDIEEHFFMTEKTMRELGVKGEAIKVKKSREIKELSGLIIPGGESTTISGFIQKNDLSEEITDLVKRGGGVMGTCAGAILLARSCDDQHLDLLGLMDYHAKRNAYGRQKDSFETPVEIKELGIFPGIFIRAPEIDKVDEKVNILACYNKKPVMVRQGKLLALTFHPELTADTRIHEYFLSLVEDGKDFEANGI